MTMDELQQPEFHDDILKVRAFNRFHTRLVGALNEGHLSSKYSLTQVRMLYELNHGKNIAASDLMQTLNLDRGYLSRMIAVLEKDGLIRKNPDTKNAKRLIIELTDRGIETSNAFEKNSSAEVENLLSTLSATARKNLLRSMDNIQQHLGTKLKQPAYIIRDPEPGDLGWIIHRHGALYAQELDWDNSFEGVVAQIIANYIKDFDAKKERCWIAEHCGDIAGSIFLTKGDEPEEAKLRMLYVEPSARGLGIGERLVEECIRFAKRKNYKRLVLWTHSIQTSAVNIYKNKGFKLIAEEKVHSFGKDLISQTMALEL